MTLAIIIGLILLVILFNKQSQKGIKQITTTELKQRLHQKNVQLIDVRTKREFQGGNIKEAKNIPLHELGKQLNKLRTDQEVIVICQSGMRSRKAASTLKKNGFNTVANVKGGMSAWSK